MKKDETMQLHEKIAALELKKKHHFHAMKQDYHELVESIKPQNIVKNTWNKITNGEDSELRNQILDTAVGLGTGYITKKILFRGSGLKGKIFGGLLQLVITNLVAKNADSIKNWGLGAFKSLLHKKNKDREYSEEEIKRLLPQ